MKYASINPFNDQLIREFPLHPYPDLDLSQKGFVRWRKMSIAERGDLLGKVAELISANKKEYARLITLEMGKPVAESEYELNKTLLAFDYYRKHAAIFLEHEVVQTQAGKSYIAFEPLGIIFSVMPWNFPFWQVFRFAIPTLISGNVTILKHAPNVPQCALAIEQLFKDAGFPEGVFINYFLSHEDAGRLIADPAIAGISFTGSDATGSLLAEQAGRNIKKCVMELGGNDAFIVMEDADLDFAVAGAVKSRSINAGQSCNGAKRFFLPGNIAGEFVSRLSSALSSLKLGDPTMDTTHIGPLARKDLAEKVRKQISRSEQLGALALRPTGFKDNGNFVAPVILENVQPGMPAFDEEIFGPVWSIIVVKDVEEAISLANQSSYGLGASIWTSDKSKAEGMVPRIQAGNVFINDIVKSDPRLPFGGIKRSGFGRELAEFGLKEFVNVKTVYIN